MLAATARLWLLAALPALTGNARWVAVAGGEVVTAAATAATAAGPAFAPDQRTALLAATGELAELTCHVLRLGDKSVSWVRSRDLQIVAHGGGAFTADARVAAAAARRGRDAAFTLRIRPLRAQDSGRYECQVNTEPKLSLFFNLTVLEEERPRVVVRAERERERGVAGGSATLGCEARLEPAPRALPAPALALTWRRRSRDRDARPLQSWRGGVSLETERWGASRLVSRLTLADLRAADAGTYECVAAAPGAGADAGADVTATVTLLVGERDGEEAAETMQRDQSPLSAASVCRWPPHPVLAALPVLAMLAALAGR